MKKKKKIKSTNLGYIWDLEKEIKKQINIYSPLITFKGDKAECFLDYNKIEKYLQNKLLEEK